MPMYTCVSCGQHFKIRGHQVGTIAPYSEMSTSNSSWGSSPNKQYDRSIQHPHTLAQSERGKQIFGWVIVVECVAGSSFVKQIHKQTSVFWFWQLESRLSWLYHLYNFSPNTVKLSIVPAALKICIQREVFTQWDTHSYKQWQTLSWIMHFLRLLWEC